MSSLQRGTEADVGPTGAHDCDSQTVRRQCESESADPSPSNRCQCLSAPRGKQRHIPIDISQYVPLSPTYPPSESPTGPKNAVSVKRHVPILIPEFAHPFIKDPARKPDFQETLQGWSRGPWQSGLKEPDESPVYGTTDRMSASQSNQSLNESLQNGHDPSAETGTPQSGNAGVLSPATQQQMEGAGPTNLSGLVCNVHRTTGKEPHPLVGATTTILEDKLYVFGGRILSRRKPHLTSDLYELDLIKRHWTKLET